MMVNDCELMEMVPERVCAPGLGVTVYITVPLALALDPPVMLNHDDPSVLAPQPHDEVTPMVPFPPVASKLATVEFSAGVQTPIVKTTALELTVPVVTTMFAEPVLATKASGTVIVNCVGLT